MKLAVGHNRYVAELKEASIAWGHLSVHDRGESQIRKVLLSDSPLASVLQKWNFVYHDFKQSTEPLDIVYSYGRSHWSRGFLCAIMITWEKVHDAM